MIYFSPLTENHIREIIDININDTKEFIYNQTGVNIYVDHRLKNKIFMECKLDYGARPIQRAIVKHIINPVSDGILNSKVTKHYYLS